jgi:uncharacterized BrkB/YihY/UPF0761 family membrane protein
MVSVVLLVVLIIIGAVLSFGVILEQLGVAGCSGATSTCDFGLLGVTTWITPVVALSFVVLTVLALAIRAKTSRPSWWVPLVGVVLTVIGFAVASALVSVALPQ